MNLKGLADQSLLHATKTLVKKEREVLTEVLHHLREVERRRLYCDLGFQSLFEYAVKELKYSEGQAGRRLQAMRLIKEIPEVEQKIQSGALSLSNISQAQSFFRESKKREPDKPISPKEKMSVLAELENKSSREGQRVLLQRQPEAALPKERERQVSESHIEVRFVMSGELRGKLDKLRSLLGPSASAMSFSDLLEHMTEIAIDSQIAKRFGKRQTASEPHPTRSSGGTSTSQGNKKPTSQGNTKPTSQGNAKPASKLSVEHLRESSLDKSHSSINTPVNKSATPTTESSSRNARHIPKSIKYQVWRRDGGRCTSCGSHNNINFDHIRPVALGGGSEPDNLRLLCFNCNQRQAIKSFGLATMERFLG